MSSDKPISDKPIRLHTVQTAYEYLNSVAPGVFSKIRTRFILRAYGYRLGRVYVIPESTLDAVLNGELPLPSVRNGRMVEPNGIPHEVHGRPEKRTS